MKLDLTGVKGFIATVLIVLSLIVGVLNAVQNALPPTVESLGVSNFDTLQVGDGSVSEPAFGFTSDTDTGLYRIGANDLGLAVNGTKVGEFTASGFVGSVGTANQSNITNLGTQAYLTATNATVTNGTVTYLSATDVTGTLATANQKNVTNLGTQTYLTATNLTVGASAITGMSVISASVTNGSLVAHGLGAIPKVVCTPILGDLITDTVSISATNATSFTVAIVDAALAVYSPDTVIINCWAFK